MQIQQVVLSCWLQILMSKRRVWETRPTTDTSSGNLPGEFRVRRIYAFAYDPFGRRIKKIVSPAGGGSGEEITNYVYDGQSIIMEYDQNNNIIAKYTHGPNIDEPLALQQGTNIYYYHADGLGSITSLSNASGSPVQTYTYDSFGNITQTGSISQPYAFTGREYDSETGMYFYRARYYDPKVGRFVTKDPIGFEGGDVNLYNYVFANPVNLNDPSGEVAPLAIIAGITAITMTAQSISPFFSWAFKQKIPSKDPGAVRGSFRPGLPGPVPERQCPPERERPVASARPPSPINFPPGVTFSRGK